MAAVARVRHTSLLEETDGRSLKSQSQRSQKSQALRWQKDPQWHVRATRQRDPKLPPTLVGYAPLQLTPRLVVLKIGNWATSR